jgi:cytochrome c5
MRTFVFLVLLAGCTDKPTPTGTTCADPDPITGTTTLTYDNFGKAFMEDYCTRCHSSALTGAARNGAPSDHNFDTLALIKDTEPEHLDEEAAGGATRVNTGMPPSGAMPTEAERRKLGEWLKSGTPYRRSVGGLSSPRGSPRRSASCVRSAPRGSARRARQ